jgi:hypothetical protein
VGVVDSDELCDVFEVAEREAAEYDDDLVCQVQELVFGQVRVGACAGVYVRGEEEVVYETGEASDQRLRQIERFVLVVADYPVLDLLNGGRSIKLMVDSS